jgi:folylpolyglutamate synthase
MRTYQDAIQHLNHLQTNAAALDALKKTGKLMNQRSIPEMRDYMHRIGYTPQDLEALHIIHIAGTKGKGSTSAFCNSILMQCELKARSRGDGRPLKVGLFTSPHLLQVRERIRVQGIPISSDLFAKYFFDVWDRLEASKVHMRYELKIKI